MFGGIIQFGGPGTAGPYDCDNPRVDQGSSQVSDSVFRGPPFDLATGDPAVIHGVWIAGTIAIECPPVLWGPVSGSHHVVRSHFESVAEGVAVAGFADGRLVVGGSRHTGNTMQNVAVGVLTLEVSNSDVTVSHNHIADAEAWGTLFVQGVGAETAGYPAPALSNFLVAYNTVDAIRFADGGGVFDLGALITGETRANVRFVKNHYNLKNIEFGGIFGLGANDVSVIRNAFTGNAGTAAVYHGVEGEPSGNWQIRNNDVTGLGAAVAKIWLGPGSFTDLVITENPDDDVLDEGTDNTILGPGRSRYEAQRDGAMPSRVWSIDRSMAG